jgi:large subunit ribosomal protein L10
MPVFLLPMPLTRQQKEKTVSHMSENISGATSVVFLSFNGLSLADMNEVRDKLFAAGCSLRVVPKRLLALVMHQTKFDFKPISHQGQLAVIWGPDAVTPAKVVYEFAKDREQLELLAGTLEGELISFEQVQELAQLPSGDELLARLVGALAGPMRGLAGVLSGLPRATVYVLKAIADQKQ